jgi:Leucine-rich repeat (LRR) protein
MPNLENIKSLLIFDNLKGLTINNSNIVDISTIANLKKLSVLRLIRCHEIIDLSPIGNLENLYYLEIINCSKIDSIYSISNLINIKHFETDIKVTNEELNHIVNLKGLTYLMIRSPFFDNVSPLLKLPKGISKNS